MLVLKPKNAEIKTDKILLRNFNTTDTEAYFKVLGNPKVSKWLGQANGFSKPQTLQWIQGIRFWWDKHGFGPWAVIERQSGELIGHCGLKFAETATDIELMYAIRPDKWGNGYATEAARASCLWAFDTLKVQHLIAITHANNFNSQALLKRLLFEQQTELKLNHELHYVYGLSTKPQ